MKNDGIYLYKSSFKCRVCIGFRSEGFMRIGDDGFEIGAVSKSNIIAGFGKVDGVDLIEGVID